MNSNVFNPSFPRGESNVTPSATGTTKPLASTTPVDSQHHQQHVPVSKSGKPDAFPSTLWIKTNMKIRGHYRTTTLRRASRRVPRKSEVVQKVVQNDPHIFPRLHLRRIPVENLKITKSFDRRKRGRPTPIISYSRRVPKSCKGTCHWRPGGHYSGKCTCCCCTPAIQETEQFKEIACDPAHRKLRWICGYCNRIFQSSDSAERLRAHILAVHSPTIEINDSAHQHDGKPHYYQLDVTCYDRHDGCSDATHNELHVIMDYVCTKCSPSRLENRRIGVVHPPIRCNNASLSVSITDQVPH